MCLSGRRQDLGMVNISTFLEEAWAGTFRLLCERTSAFNFLHSSSQAGRHALQTGRHGILPSRQDGGCMSRASDGLHSSPKMEQWWQAWADNFGGGQHQAEEKRHLGLSST